jgi:hypothetical protein
MLPPPPLKPGSQANFQALNAQLGDNCAAPILEPERSALLQEALADSQLQAVKAQLVCDNGQEVDIIFKRKS